MIEKGSLRFEMDLNSSIDLIERILFVLKNYKFSVCNKKFNLITLSPIICTCQFNYLAQNL